MLGAVELIPLVPPVLNVSPQPFGVISLIPGDSVQGGIHHRKVLERLNYLKDLAGRHVERTDRIERAGRAQVGDLVICVWEIHGVILCVCHSNIVSILLTANDQDPEHRQQQQDNSGSAGGGVHCGSMPSYSNAFQIPVGESTGQLLC